MPPGTKQDRIVAVVIAATVGYAIAEAIVSEARDKRARFAKWYDTFAAPFLKNPGRREYLRDALLREEMTLRKPRTTILVTKDDCGCDDA